MDQLNFPAPPFFDPAALREEFTAYWQRERRKPGASARARAQAPQGAQGRRPRAGASHSDAHAGRAPMRGGPIAVPGRADQAHLRLLRRATYTAPRTPRRPSAWRWSRPADTDAAFWHPARTSICSFCFPTRRRPGARASSSSILYFLWDLGYKVGHATRTTEQTLKARQGGHDHPDRRSWTSRLIHGEAALFERHADALRVDVVQGTPARVHRCKA